MEDTLKRLEKKLYNDDQDQSDFLKVKDIYARVFEKRRGETAENHTTPQYIWRTAGDGKVRREHAVNDGKIFSWDNPPPTGHPGEDFGCRCWAEAYIAVYIRLLCFKRFMVFRRQSRP
jgi:SPP1 gp7 family putative phage head morphogenesis protein